MDSIGVEEEYAHLEVVTDPREAHFLFDSVEKECLRFSGWKKQSDVYSVATDAGVIVTVPRYLSPKNRYYFVQSESFEQTV